MTQTQTQTHKMSMERLLQDVLQQLQTHTVELEWLQLQKFLESVLLQRQLSTQRRQQLSPTRSKTTRSSLLHGDLSMMVTDTRDQDLHLRLPSSNPYVMEEEEREASTCGQEEMEEEMVNTRKIGSNLKAHFFLKKKKVTTATMTDMLTADLLLESEHSRTVELLRGTVSLALHSSRALLPLEDQRESPPVTSTQEEELPVETATPDSEELLLPALLLLVKETLQYYAF